MGKPGAQSGERNPNWKGGRSVASNGYVLIKAPWHPLADVRGYVYEHRLVAEQALGRPLAEGEIVHHKNHEKQDNRAENLEVVASIAHHRAEHRKPGSKPRRSPGEDNDSVTCACGCGATFERYDASGRPRRFVSGHNAQPREAARG